MDEKNKGMKSITTIKEVFSKQQDQMADIKKENEKLNLITNNQLERNIYSILNELIGCTLWEYDIKEKRVYQTRKFNGRHSDKNITIDNFRETYCGRGLIYPEDVKVFEQFCDSMDRGDDFFKYDLRSFVDIDGFKWIRFQGVGIKDEQGIPVKIVGITLNVDNEKKEYELLSRRAEQDSLSGMYNKNATREYVSKYINGTGKLETHALLIIDLDNFKQINDHWGHLYGDYVLETFSKELIKLFTREDIIGRIGGDEFIVFKKRCYDNRNIYDISIEAAESIIIMVRSMNLKKGHNLAVSIGIANYPENGKTFEDLYRNADIALYKAKDSGKDTYEIYNPITDYKLRRGEIIEEGYGDDLKQCSNTNTKILDEVEKRLFDFAFDIMSKNQDINTTINTILSEIGEYYDLKYISIIEKKSQNNSIHISYEWSNEILLCRQMETEDFSSKFLDMLEKRFCLDKSFICNDIQNLGEEERKFYNIIHTKSMMQSAFYDSDEFAGCIVFESGSTDKFRTEYEVNTLTIITKIISLSLLRFRSKEQLKKEIFYTKAMLNNQLLSNYCVNPDTYELVYVNEYANKLFSNIGLDEICYKTIWGREMPCDSCPIDGLKNGKERVSIETYSEENNAWYSITASKVNRKNKKEIYLMCWSDVTAFIERVKSTDSLTGFFTLEKFQAESMKLLAMQKDKKYAIAYTDFNRFKNINEEWGYSVGDNVIKMFAEQISTILLENELCCHVSGDKFIFLLKYNDCEKLVNRLEKAYLEVSVKLNEKYPQIDFNISSGLYCIKADDHYLSITIDRANIARKTLKVFKSYVKHNVVIYDNELHQKVTRRHQIENKMKGALINGEFSVYIQPKMDLATRSITGGEALVRWMQPDGKIVFPDEFIPLFERNGFIGNLDFYVYEEVFRNMRLWIDKGISSIVVSINVSRINLKEATFVERLVSLAEKYSIPTSMIELELTENIFFENLDRLLYIINKLRNKGFLISIDDFGTGYSTLNLVQILPVDILKLDKSFFLKNELGIKTKIKTIISNIINLAKGLGLKVIAEGVETEEQVLFLEETKCDMIQGYYFYKPMTVEEFGGLFN